MKRRNEIFTLLFIAFIYLSSRVNLLSHEAILEKTNRISFSQEQHIFIAREKRGEAHGFDCENRKQLLCPGCLTTLSLFFPAVQDPYRIFHSYYTGEKIIPAPAEPDEFFCSW
jgi:hypothetical protein